MEIEEEIIKLTEQIVEYKKDFLKHLKLREENERTRIKHEKNRIKCHNKFRNKFAELDKEYEDMAEKFNELDMGYKDMTEKLSISITLRSRYINQVKKSKIVVMRLIIIERYISNVIKEYPVEYKLPTKENILPQILLHVYF